MQAATMQQHYILFRKYLPIQVDIYFSHLTQPCFILLPALGVPINKYQHLINDLKLKHINVLAADYPGCGRNSPPISAHFDYGYRDLIEDFVPALLRLAMQYSQHCPVLLGHSIGGQIATLAAARHKTKIIGIATGHIGLKYWETKMQVELLKAVCAVQLLTFRYGYFPGFKIGLGHKEAKTLMRDWAKALLHSNYRHIIDIQTRLNTPALFLQLHQDIWAPMRSTLALSHYFQSPQIEIMDLSRNISGNQHSAWLKQPEQIVDACIKWYEQRSTLQPNPNHRGTQ